MQLAPLPGEVVHLLEELGAPRLLVAHLTLVHDVALHLITGLDSAWPALAYDHDAVLFGAATHDIGKVKYVGELTAPGRLHEQAGEVLLNGRGYDARLARFARTHGSWPEEAVRLEDLLVALADAVWRGKRDPLLEGAIGQRIVEQIGAADWHVYATLDDLLSEIAADADGRLEWQRRHRA